MEIEKGVCWQTLFSYGKENVLSGMAVISVKKQRREEVKNGRL